MFLEEGELVATDHTVQGAQEKLEQFSDWALGHDKKGEGNIVKRAGAMRGDL